MEAKFEYTQNLKKIFDTRTTAELLQQRRYHRGKERIYPGTGRCKTVSLEGS